MAEKQVNPEATPTEEEGPTVDERLAELEEMKSNLEAQQAQVAQQRSEVEALSQTMGSLVENLRQPAPQPPAPEPEIDYNDPAQVSAAQVRAGLTSYHQSAINPLSQDVQTLKSVAMSQELREIKDEDPVAFKALEGQLGAALQKVNYSPGVVRNVFDLLYGKNRKALRELETTQSSKADPIAEPGGGPIKKKESTSYDELDAREEKFCRQTGVDRREYFINKYDREPKFKEAS
jgi:uncharacterized coiled-coil protein SlyX